MLPNKPRVRYNKLGRPRVHPACINTAVDAR